jgi:hypothetical protein
LILYVKAFSYVGGWGEVPRSWEKVLIDYSKKPTMYIFVLFMEKKIL